MTELFKTASFSAAYGGLSTVGYALYNADSSVAAARTTAGVSELGIDTGCYGAVVSFPDGFSGSLRWDTGGASPRFAVEEINPTLASIKGQTDRMQFDASDNVKASVDAGTIEVTGLVNLTQDSIDAVQSGLATHVDEAGNANAIAGVLAAVQAVVIPTVAQIQSGIATHADAESILTQIADLLSALPSETVMEELTAGMNSAVLAADQARDAAYGVTNKLGAIQIVMIAPVTLMGEIALVQGEDYFQADGRALVWTDMGEGWPDLAGASVEWEFRRAGSTEPAATFECTVINSATVQLELSSVETSGLPFSRDGIHDSYQLWATLANGHKLRLATGPVYVGV